MHGKNKISLTIIEYELDQIKDLAGDILYKAKK